MKKLERNLGLLSVIAIAIGAMIGGGIFILPGLAASLTGPSVWLAYFIAGLLIIPAALSKSEMATAMPKAGGTYVFIDRSLGPMFGTIAGIGTWLAMLFKASFALIGLSIYLKIFADLPVKPVAFSLLALICFLNIVGVQKVGKAQMVIVIVCLVLLGVLSGRGVTGLDWSRYQNHFSGGWTGLLAATGFVFISYAGVTKIASVAEEIKDPGRNLPMAMLISLFAMMVLYSLVSFVLVGVIPMKGATAATSLINNKSSIALLGSLLYGRVGEVVVAVVAVTALVSMSNAGLLAASRYPFAMSRDGMIPERFRQVSEKYNTPVFSIVFTVACMALAIAFLPVVKIAKLASGMQVILFMAVNAGLIMFRETQNDWYKPVFYSPMYPWVQIFGILTSFLLLATLGSFVLVGTGILLLVGTGWFFYYARQKTNRRGVLQKLLAKPEGAEQASDREIDPADKVDMVIPLTDTEFSPETLVELGAAIGAHKLSVAHILSVPDATELHEEVTEITPHHRALDRRIMAMSRRLALDTEISFMSSYDRRHALYEHVVNKDASWVLIEQGLQDDILAVRKRLGWLTDSLACNIAVYKNDGIRYVQKVAVLAQPDSHDDIDVANRLAETYDAELSLWSLLPKGASKADRNTVGDYQAQLKQLCTVPRVTYHIVNSIEELNEELVGEDLLVMGLSTEPTSRFGRFRFESDLLFAEAPCSVLALKASKAQTDAEEQQAISDEREYEAMWSTILDPRTIRLQAEIETKEELFSEMSELFSKVLRLDREEVERAFREREEIASQDVGYGVAMPHATLPELQRAYLGLFVLDKPITFGDHDEKVDVVFCTLNCPTNRTKHLTFLEHLSEFSLDERFLTAVREADSTDKVVRLIRAQIQASSDEE